MLFKRLIAAAGLLMLIGCQPANEPADLKTYLEQNPEILHHNMAACSANKLPPARCEVVMTAASEMRHLIEEEQRDAQAFGERILKAEMQFADTGHSTDDIKTLLVVVQLSGAE